MMLDEVTDRLHRHGQRATYAAVGGIVGRLAISVMRGQPKSHRNSWVVAKKDGEPTGYSPGERDPRLPGVGDAIDTADALRHWLARHR